MSRSPHRARERGFTLIEVVVAFAIFALCIGALYESFGGSLRRSVAARDDGAALLAAQSLLAELRTTPGPWAPQQSGTTPDGLTWRVDARTYDAGTDPSHEWRAVEVEVSVSSARRTTGGTVLRSVELVRVPP